MSHLNQPVCDANATGVGGSPPMHQPAMDRVKVEHDGQPYYVVCLSEDDMMKIKDGLEVAYEDQPFADTIIEKFVV